MAIWRRHTQSVLAAAASVGLTTISARGAVQVIENFTPGRTHTDLAGYSAAQSALESVAQSAGQAAGQTAWQSGLTVTWLSNSNTFGSNARTGSTILLDLTTASNRTALQYPANSSLSSANPTGGAAFSFLLQNGSSSAVPEPASLGILAMGAVEACWEGVGGTDDW